MNKQPSILEPEPIVRYFRHSITKALIIVRGELASYQSLQHVEAFTCDSKSEAEQLQDESCWKPLRDAYLLEVNTSQQLRILQLISDTNDQVLDVTSSYNGPFRYSGREYDSVPALKESLQTNAEEYRGRTVDKFGKLTLFVFEQWRGTARTSFWERVPLKLSAHPIDSYAYSSGRRISVEQGLGHGTVTLWQEQSGMRRYYVETAANHSSSPAFPRLEMVTDEQLRSWYDFRFTPDTTISQ